MVELPFTSKQLMSDGFHTLRLVKILKDNVGFYFVLPNLQYQRSQLTHDRVKLEMLPLRKN
jgi:hypothetical protein